ncbi:hypothetical protein FH972_011084 [Carpinus fangiana]|uniref:Uncharacterized protein n=1 Tax=Carpinus fangiana TaxID=176857 RepID=A0A660KQ81_9ROSI|nr:hypothetical protein FH972_011084 [Carpinus fangiana]
MGPDLELKGNSKAAMVVSVGKNNAIVPQGPEDMILQCASNCEDNNFGMEVELTTEQDGSENVEVNITDFTTATDAGLVDGDCQDVTEHSSSFGDTDSGTENGLMLADDEVESQFFASNASVFDGYFDRFPIRKKKLTVHWRKFVRPLMWRCKWIELQIKELQSRTLKYDRELAVYDQRKQFDFANVTLEDIDAKSLPFSGQILRKKVMKRKKRKRDEETIDITHYMSQHNLFSYYGKKRSATDGAPMEDDCGSLDKITNSNNEFGINDGWSSLEFGNDDNFLEQILRKIEVAHSQVHKLKTRIDKIEDGILIHNKAAKEELDALEKVRSQLIEKPREPMDDKKTIPLVQVLGPGDLPSETAAPNVQSNAKSRSASKSNLPRNTRRRGRRRATSKRVRRRISG